MASPQTENGFTRIANELLEAILRTPLSSREMKCLLTVARETYGWAAKEKAVSARRIGRLTGIQPTKVSRTMKALKTRRILANGPGGVSIQKDYDQWQLSGVSSPDSSPLGHGCGSDNGGVSDPDPQTVSRSDTHKERKKQIKKEGVSGSDALRSEVDLLFDRFWRAYPRKVAKPAARHAWLRLRPDEPLLAKMLATLEVQCQSQDWTKDGHFIPHPATWLNNRRWEDEQLEPLCPPAAESRRRML